ncbi:hypothetical protein [Curtobacterium sp. MCBD17_040]|uniref:hypothetical protein n=1 Tax=Curtobacterium sp. MCBD17_040 TaxID=2175674 RepID=UPI000DA6ED0A|nr:hypothetical protein [Curtobacterium sp. MCBD17_040]WIB63727.1 hypothetical protein DEI94_00645 [Curtobacterium sp. MCBD17_040]
MPSESKDQQIRWIVEALAAATLAQGVSAVTSGKQALESSLGSAWRNWDRAAAFPSIAGFHASNMLWGGLQRSDRRRGAVAAWDMQQWAAPYLVNAHWEVADVLEMRTDGRASARDWLALGAAFVAAFNDSEVQRP